MRPERHGHWSLRFDAYPETLARVLVDLIEAEGLSLLTTTESRNPALVRALRRRLPAGYAVTRRFEYLYVWHRPTYRAHWLAALAALDPRAWAMLGGRREFRVARKRFQHRPSGRRLRAEVAHAPSGVDAGGGHWSHQFPARVTISASGFAAWGDRVRRFKRRHPRGALVAHMDSNLDQASERWRSWLEGRLDAPSVWSTAGVPDAGTHGRRLIDTAHVTGLEVHSAHVLDPHRPPKVDHRPITYAASY